jgi:dephospho-CoA kinase
MLRIGLTGGIGSGKSTVAALFAAYGIPVIDADVIAHRLTLPGASATQQIVEVFGTDIAAAGGAIDRQRLAQRVFANPAERARLEEILHPLIHAEMLREQEGLTVPYCLLVIPLLIEARQQDLVDRVLVVDVDEHTQLARAQARGGRREAEIRAILGAQVGRAQRLKLADDCITNSGDLAALKSQIGALHLKYLALSAEKHGGR